MNPKDLKSAQTYSYKVLDQPPILIQYWYEQLNYWSFTTVDEPRKIILLHSQHIKYNLQEI
jgi:hypothetical protein